MLTILGDEWEKFDIPNECDNFIISIDGCDVYPIFHRRNDTLRVEYDMMLCDTQIRSISFSIYLDAHRIEITLKDDKKIDNSF
jgi:hypothetical protein